MHPPPFQDVEAAAAASKRLRSRGERERDAEIAKQAAALEDVAEADEFSTWAKKEDAFTRHQWQPIRRVLRRPHCRGFPVSNRTAVIAYS